MKKKMLIKKLNDLLYNINESKKSVGSSEQELLSNLESLVNMYIDKVQQNEMPVSNGSGLGFRRAILEFDSLAEIDSLYDAAKDVDMFYGDECRSF